MSRAAASTSCHEGEESAGNQSRTRMVVGMRVPPPQRPVRVCLVAEEELLRREEAQACVERKFWRRRESVVGSESGKGRREQGEDALRSVSAWSSGRPAASPT